MLTKHFNKHSNALKQQPIRALGPSTKSDWPKLELAQSHFQRFAAGRRLQKTRETKKDDKGNLLKIIKILFLIMI